VTRAVAVDLGSARIGVAVTDGTLAFPRPFVARTGDRGAEHRAIAAVVDEVGAEVLVVGLPISLDGSHGPAARHAAAEARDLSHELPGIRVETFDERLTTVSAEAGLRAAGRRGAQARRRSVDSAAATVLLEAWLAAAR